MDFYQGVVIDFLRADRSLFVNTEFCLQLAPGNPDQTTHWYCDAVVLDFSNKVMWLTEISFAKNVPALRKRLRGWKAHWAEIDGALRQLSQTGESCAGWPVSLWLFVPGGYEIGLAAELDGFRADQVHVRVTPLEDVQPWKYRSWDRASLPLSPTITLRS